MLYIYILYIDIYICIYIYTYIYIYIYPYKQPYVYIYMYMLKPYKQRLTSPGLLHFFASSSLTARSSSMQPGWVKPPKSESQWQQQQQ